MKFTEAHALHGEGMEMEEPHAKWCEADSENQRSKCSLSSVGARIKGGRREVSDITEIGKVGSIEERRGEGRAGAERGGNAEWIHVHT